jgi:hypothetical protein
MLGLATGVYHEVRLVWSPKQRSYMRPAVEYLHRYRQPDEPVYLVGAYTPTFLVYWGEPDALIRLDYNLHVPIDTPRFWVIQGFEAGKPPGAQAARSKSLPDRTRELVTPGSSVTLYEPLGNPAATQGKDPASP